MRLLFKRFPLCIAFGIPINFSVIKVGGCIILVSVIRILRFVLVLHLRFFTGCFAISRLGFLFFFFFFLFSWNLSEKVWLVGFTEKLQSAAYYACLHSFSISPIIFFIFFVPFLEIRSIFQASLQQFPLVSSL